MHLRLSCFAAGFAALVSVWPAIASADLVEYSAGHADIGLAYHSGDDDHGEGLDLHYHFGTGAVLDGVSQGSDSEFGPGEAYVRVGDAVKTQLTSGLDFLEASAGDDVWVLPQSSEPGVPFLGIAAEELSSSDFSSATLSMTGFSGPGQFALWQPDSVGGSPDVFWQTSDGISDDELDLVIGGHDHFNWGFTEEGVYEVELTGVANFTGDNVSISDVGTFSFAVGEATAIPEPGAFLALASLGVLGCGVVAIRHRRRSGQALSAAA